jgi:hypothetical protein
LTAITTRRLKEAYLSFLGGTALADIQGVDVDQRKRERARSALLGPIEGVPRSRERALSG